MRERVATTWVRHAGGPCRHCSVFMGRGSTMVKLTDCCIRHTPTARGTRNGKGVWVCLKCADTLCPVEVQQGELW